MNNERRKRIKAIATKLDELRATFDSLREEVETIRDEEQEAFDAMPESFQNGEKGEKSQAAIDALDEAVSTIEGWDIDEVVGSLDTATE